MRSRRRGLPVSSSRYASRSLPTRNWASTGPTICCAIVPLTPGRRQYGWVASYEYGTSRVNCTPVEVNSGALRAHAEQGSRKRPKLDGACVAQVPAFRAGIDLVAWTLTCAKPGGRPSERDPVERRQPPYRGARVRRTLALIPL